MDNNSINQDNNPVDYIAPAYMPFNENIYANDSYFASLPKEDQEYILATKHHFMSREELQRLNIKASNHPPGRRQCLPLTGDFCVYANNEQKEDKDVRKEARLYQLG